jgi:hypothetical protein
MQGSEFVHRAAGTADAQALVRLFKAAFGRHLDPGWWAWRFLDGPGERPGVVRVTLANNEPVAHYAVARVALSVDGTEYLTGLSGTSMTAPEMRGRGLFVSLANAAYEILQSDGWHAVWGFPNAAIHSLRVRQLGWTTIAEVPTLRLRLSDGLETPPATHHITATVPIDRELDALWRRAKAAYRVIADRSAAALQWRFVRCPDVDYGFLAAWGSNQELKGYAVTKRYHDELHIVDILAPAAEQAFVDLVSAVIRLAQEDQLQAVSLWTNVHRREHQILEQLRFLNQTPIFYLGGRVLRPNNDLPECLDYRNWYLTMADSDIF